MYVCKGMFFLWISCNGIFLVGIGMQIWRPHAVFYPLVMLGGAIWTTGNMLLPLIVRTIGLGIGLLIYCTSATLVGWTTARFSPHLLHILHIYFQSSISI